MANDREIAGIRCTQILDGLSDYLADDVPVSTRGQIEAHLAECTWCDHFGGEFRTILAGLRARLSEPAPVSQEETTQLLDFLNLEAT